MERLINLLCFIMKDVLVPIGTTVLGVWAGSKVASKDIMVQIENDTKINRETSTIDFWLSCKEDLRLLQADVIELCNQLEYFTFHTWKFGEDGMEYEDKNYDKNYLELERKISLVIDPYIDYLKIIGLEDISRVIEFEKNWIYTYFGEINELKLLARKRDRIVEMHSSKEFKSKGFNKQFEFIEDGGEEWCIDSHFRTIKHYMNMALNELISKIKEIIKE